MLEQEVSEMSIQRYELKAIVEEYVDLKSLNPKPLFETLEFLFTICGEKPVSEYTRGDARQFVKVYGSKGRLLRSDLLS